MCNSIKTNEKNKKEKKFYWTVAFRWRVIQQIEAELLTEQRACDEYGITCILIRKWRKQYLQRKILPLQTTQPMKRKQNQSEKIKVLEVKLLERQNKQLQVEAYAHKTMVDIAEKELNISIRKKSGVKR